MLSRLALFLLAALCSPQKAAATNAPQGRGAVRAEDGSLVLAVQSLNGMEAVVEAFRRAHPEIRVKLTVQGPSALAPRILAEQRNGIYAWDSWWGLSANMNNVVLPAGGFDPIDGDFLSPEIKDGAKWRTGRPLHSSPARPFVFIHSAALERTALLNRSATRGLTIRTVRDLLHPRLKGRIAIRDPSRPNSGSYALSAMLDEAGPDFVRRLMSEMEPVLVENGRQLMTGVMRGDYAVAIGTPPDLYITCKQGGGCREISQLPFGTYLNTFGVAVLKNPPHPNAAKLWVNWLLSREGQSRFVAAFRSVNAPGAVSLRSDVEPDPSQPDAVPDFARLDQYTAPGLEGGKASLDELKKILAEARSSSTASFDPWKGVAYALIALLVALLAFHRLLKGSRVRTAAILDD
jgi:ABC-type Fe3+ transport system substrate-binding protein